MASDLLLGGLSAGADLAGTALSAYAQSRQNQKNREWSEKMYGLQRADALKDWNMQNAYNSPAEQMERFKAANLNPNLIYGQTNNAAPVRSVSGPSYEGKAPTFDIGGAARAGITAYQDSRMKNAQTDNLEAATKVSNQEAILKAAQTAATALQSDTTKFNLEKARSLLSMDLEKAGLELQGMKQSQDIALSANERAAAQNAMSLKEAAQRILNMRLQNAKTEDERKILREQLRSASAEAGIKEKELELRLNNVNPNDPTFLKVVSEIVNNPNWFRDWFNKFNPLPLRGGKLK